MPKMTNEEPKNEDSIRDAKGRYKPGCSGFKGAGRPLGSISLVNLLRKRLQEHPEEADSIVDALIRLGKGKELGAIRELLDRIDGKVAERHQIEGNIPVSVLFVPAEQVLASKEKDKDKDKPADVGK